MGIWRWLVLTGISEDQKILSSKGVRFGEKNHKCCFIASFSVVYESLRLLRSTPVIRKCQRCIGQPCYLFPDRIEDGNPPSPLGTLPGIYLIFHRHL